jgi:hypothetical protein
MRNEEQWDKEKKEIAAEKEEKETYFGIIYVLVFVGIISVCIQGAIFVSKLEITSNGISIEIIMIAVVAAIYLAHKISRNFVLITVKSIKNFLKERYKRT